MWTRGDEATLLVYNSFSSGLVQLFGSFADRVEDILIRGEPIAVDEEMASLMSQGIVVPLDADELRRAELLHRALLERDDGLHLIVMPTEQCNFRCVYCYEEFARGRMQPDVRAGIVELVRARADRLKTLTVSWFGGEPLAALDIIEEISGPVRSLCQAAGISFLGGVTTNGYLLSTDRRQRLYAAGVRDFQVTVDGPPESHDQLRVLAGGGRTFERIHTNLLDMRQDSADFRVRIRVNYTRGSAPLLPDFVTTLGREFGDDSRFHVDFHAVGRWGGDRDHDLDVCDQHASSRVEARLAAKALGMGLPLDAWRAAMQPFGSVCYAANPRSFVIGADGTVYKCTVAFRDPRNHVGRLTSDGDLHLDEDRMRLWTESGEETDAGCQACAFRPACQGNACPAERLNSGAKACPTFKTTYHERLPLIAVSPGR